MEDEVNEKINSTPKLYHVLNNTFISKKKVGKGINIIIQETVFQPVYTAFVYPLSQKPLKY